MTARFFVMRVMLCAIVEIVSEFLVCMCVVVLIVGGFAGGVVDDLDTLGVG